MTDWSALRGQYHAQMSARGIDLGGGLALLEARIYSQMGEDGMIAGIAERLGVTAGSFLDIGAGGAGQGISNTRALAERGWAGVAIDSDESEVCALRSTHAGRPVIVASAMVTGDNVAALCEQLGVAADLTVASIDVDGDDWYIWRALPRSPRLVVIEYNASLPLNGVLVQPAGAGPWRGTDYFGASLGALEWLAGHLGYGLVHADGINAYFVHAGDVADVMRGESLLRRPLIERLPVDTTGRRYVDPRGPS